MAEREVPCPDRIPYDSGVAFSLGIVLGTMWNSIKGFRENPNRRWFGIKTMVSQNAPRLGGNFAAWGTLFVISECSLIGIRKQDDWMNRVAAGGITSACLAVRGGKGAMFRGALIGASLLGAIEGITHFISRKMAITPDADITGEERKQVDAQRHEQTGHAQQIRSKSAEMERSTESSYDMADTSSDSGSSSSSSSSGGYFMRRGAY